MMKLPFWVGVRYGAVRQLGRLHIARCVRIARGHRRARAGAQLQEAPAGAWLD